MFLVRKMKDAFIELREKNVDRTSEIDHYLHSIGWYTIRNQNCVLIRGDTKQTAA